MANSPATVQKASEPENLRNPVQDNGPVPAETELNEKASTFLMYVAGKGSHREITQTQFKEAGVDFKDVVFGPLNGLKIAIGTKGGLTQEVVDILLRQKDDNGLPEFAIVDADGNPKDAK